MLPTTEKRSFKRCSDVISRSAHSHTHTDAQKLFGSGRWVVCPIFGTVGLALPVFSPMRQVRSTSPLNPGSDLFECLHTLHDALPLIQPVEFPLFRRKDYAIVVFSDASWSANSGRMWVLYFGALAVESYFTLPVRFPSTLLNTLCFYSCKVLTFVKPSYLHL